MNTIESEPEVDESPKSGAPSFRIVAEVNLPKGLPGFFAERKFALLDLGDDYNPYMALRSFTSELTLIVVEPRFVVEDYQVHVDDPTQNLLGLTRSEDALVLVIATLRENKNPVVNLLGPIVLNVDSKIAAQVVQVESDYSVTHEVSLALRASDRVVL
jgi:flagellar assembly factor FliW